MPIPEKCKCGAFLRHLDVVTVSMTGIETVLVPCEGCGKVWVYRRVGKVALVVDYRQRQRSKDGKYWLKLPRGWWEK